MSRWKRAEWRDLWLSAMVGLLGIALALASWGLLVADRRDQLVEDAREVARASREAVEFALREQHAALRGLSELWASFGLRPEAEWRANVGQRVDQIPGLTYVAWVDLDERNNRIAFGQRGVAREIDLDAEEARVHYGQAHVSGPERDPAGGAAYRMFLPVGTPEDHAGVLVGRFRLDAFFEAVFRARARGYAVEVFWGAERIYARGTPSADPWQRWWRAEETLALPLGGQRWRILQRPTPELAAARLTPVLHYLLAVGILLSLVLALLTYQLRLVVRQSRHLAESNRALEERGQELESRVAERTAALRDAVAELEAFNYSVSHDLRSPLGAILNFGAILEEDYPGRPLDAEGMKILARIQRSAKRATELLDGLLLLSRAGRAALDLERIDMAALARESFAQVGAGALDADVELHIGPLPEAVGDRALLGDVFANLLGNALKYSRGCEKRRIAVSGRRESGECIYEVADSGRGFDMRFVERIFGLFERLHAEEQIEGTGVGLAVVSRIVQRHGGRVWAEGRPGEGARFGFALPERELP